VLIARRLRCKTLIIPDVGATLSAAGGLISELTTNYRVVTATRSDNFDYAAVRGALADLRARADKFLAQTAPNAISSNVSFRFEGHYPSQVWDIEVPMAGSSVESPQDVETLVAAFHRTHDELFAVIDANAPVEIVGWQVHVSVKLRDDSIRQDLAENGAGDYKSVRRSYFRETGEIDAVLCDFDRMPVGEVVEGPAIVESPLTTIVVNAGSAARKAESGSLVIQVLEA